MKAFLVSFLLFFSFTPAIKQQTAFLAEDIITKKNFYIVHAVNRSTTIRQLMPVLYKQSSVVAGYLFTANEISLLDSTLGVIYDSHQKIIDRLINSDIRPSHCYQLFNSLSNKELWLKCWALYFTGINYIIDEYGLGKKGRYPNIDSARYYVAGSYYQQLLKTLFVYLQPSLRAAKYFYENPLTVAIRLMLLNDRDEAARHEPLEKKDNKLVYEIIKTIAFKDFRYSCIVVPGDGPQKMGISLSPFSKIRCSLAAQKFRQQLAPVIILTGGYCHPFQTPFSEAVEMKNYLIAELDIPASAIIIDPHARHTTTNFRNACRYIFQYRLPIDKEALFVTTVEQADYVMKGSFDQRNLNELGYLPYKNKTRLSDHEIGFYPVRESLHRDPTDPLDP